MYLYKPAIQFGFGKDMQISTVEVPGKGYVIIGTYEFGFNIFNKQA